MATTGSVEVPPVEMPKADLTQEFEKGKNLIKYQHFYSLKDKR